MLPVPAAVSRTRYRVLTCVCCALLLCVLSFWREDTSLEYSQRHAPSREPEFRAPSPSSRPRVALDHAEEAGAPWVRAPAAPIVSAAATGVSGPVSSVCNPRSLHCGCLKTWNISSSCSDSQSTLPRLILHVEGAWRAAAVVAEDEGSSTAADFYGGGPRGGLHACRRSMCDVYLLRERVSSPDIQFFTGLPSGGYVSRAAPMFLMGGSSSYSRAEPRERLFYSGFFSDIDDARVANVSDARLAPTFHAPATFLSLGLSLSQRNLGLIALVAPPWSDPAVQSSPDFGSWGVDALGAAYKDEQAIASSACMEGSPTAVVLRACVVSRARFLLVPADGGAAAAVYEALAAGVVPVMPRGAGAGPLADLPRSAAVWADDFASAGALRAALEAASASTDAFSFYFTWKRAPLPELFLRRLRHSYATAFCDACDLAVEDSAHILPSTGAEPKAGGPLHGPVRLPRCAMQRLDRPFLQRDWLLRPPNGYNTTVYVIARSDSPRLPAFRRRLTAAGLGAHLVIGFDRSNMTSDDMACWASDSPADTRDKFGPSTSEIANGAATFAALWAIFQSGEPGLIIEDDVIFRDFWHEKYPLLMDQVPLYPKEEKGQPRRVGDVWDALWLSIFQNQEPPLLGEPVLNPPDWYAARHNVSLPYLFNQMHGSRGCSAYIVTPRGATKLLNSMPLRFPFDHQINYAFKESWLTILHTRPPLIQEAAFVPGFVFNESDGWNPSVSLLGEDRKRRPGVPRQRRRL